MARRIGDWTRAKLEKVVGLTVEEADGSPSVNSVTKIKVSNGTLTDDGSGTVTVTTGGGGGGGAPTDAQYVVLAVDGDLSAERVLTAGTGISLTDAGANGNITVAATNNGDASGPGSSTNNAIVRFDGAGGKTLQNSGCTIDDSNNLTIAGDLTVSGDNITMNTNTSGYILLAGGSNFAPAAPSSIGADLVSGQGAITAVDTTNDYLLVWDGTDSALKKATVASVVSTGRLAADVNTVLGSGMLGTR